MYSKEWHYCKDCKKVELVDKHKMMADLAYYYSVFVSNGCLMWTGSVINGYGTLAGMLAHRFSFRLYNGPIPEGYVVSQST